MLGAAEVPFEVVVEVVVVELVSVLPGVVDVGCAACGTKALIVRFA